VHLNQTRGSTKLERRSAPGVPAGRVDSPLLERRGRKDTGATTIFGGLTKAERLFIPGPAGRLEALLEYDPAREARATALVCHPHPLFGGTMHNKVVYRAAKAAIIAGLPTLRFNFRGVGASEGAHADGTGEHDDVRAALDYLVSRFPALPVCMMGYSFGAAVGLAVGVNDPRTSALVGLGIPASIWDLGFLRGASKPTLIVQGTRDFFGPRDALEPVFAALAGPKQLRWIDGADHGFSAKLDELQEAVRAFLAQIV
jgi:alpha/beta superfamily hydrolase